MNKFRISLILMGLFFLFPFTIKGIPLVSIQDNFQPRVFSTKQGLSQTRIKSLISLNEETLLVGTTSGLYRFTNGLFSSADDTYQLKNPYIRILYKSQKGIWIGYQDGVGLFSENKMRFYGEKQGLTSKQVNDILEKDGKVYFATNSGISVFDGLQITDVSGELKNKIVWSLGIDLNGNLICGMDNSIATYTQNSWKIENLKSDPVFSQIKGNLLVNGIVSAFGKEWISTFKGLFYREQGKWKKFLKKQMAFLGKIYFDSLNNSLYVGASEGPNSVYGLFIIRQKQTDFSVSRARKVEGLISNHVSAITYNSKGIYAGSDAGLTWVPQNFGILSEIRNPVKPKKKINFNVVTTKKEYVTLKKEEFPMPWRNVQSIYNDSKGVLWIGTNGDGVYRFNGEKFQKLTVKDNLSSNIIYSIKEFKGETYIGTSAGLCVFDGFKIRKLGKTDGLNGDLIWSLYSDSEFLWVGTVNGLFRYDGFIFTHFHKENSNLPDNWVGCIKKDFLNTLWIGTDDGVVAFDGKTFQVMDEFSTGLLNNWIYSIAIFQGEYWFATPKGVASFNGKNWSSYTLEFENNPVNSLQVFQGELFAGVEKKGLMKFNGSEFQVLKPPLGEINLSALSLYSDEKYLYTGWEKGLITLFDGANWKTYNLKRINQGIGSFVDYWGLKEGLPGSIVYDIGIRAVSPEKKEVWVCTDGGVAVLENNKVVRTYKKSDGLAFDSVQSVDFFQQKVFLGTFQGLSILENGTFTNYTSENSGLIADTIWKLKVDQVGKLWIGTVFGLNSFDGKNWETFQRTEGVPFAENWIYDVKLREDGLPTIGIWGGGIARLDPSGWTVFNDNDGSFSEDLILDDEITSRVVTALDVSGKNDFFAATYIGGSLYKNGKFTTVLEKTKPVLSEFITGVFFEKKDPDIVWMATDLGLMKWNIRNDQWIHFQRGEGVKPYIKITFIDGINREEIEQSGILPDNYCWSIKEDDNYIWVGTIKGLALYRK